MPKFLPSVLGAECRASYTPGKHSIRNSIPAQNMFQRREVEGFLLPGHWYSLMLPSPFIPCLYFPLTQLDISLNRKKHLNRCDAIPRTFRHLVERDPGIREHLVMAE